MNSSVIDATATRFEKAVQQMTHAFAQVPDDKLNWSPTPTSRTPIQILVHAGDAILNLHQMMQGTPFTVSTSKEAEAMFRAHEREFSTKEAALNHFDTNSSNFLSWLKALPVDQLETLITLPFGMGEAPISVALGFPSDHTIWHTAQMDYVQTAYGDHDWHTGF